MNTTENYNYKYGALACWYVANGYECIHKECTFSHDACKIYEYRKKMCLFLCEHGINCPTKCNRIHNAKNIFYDCYNETRKRLRITDELEDCSREVKKLKKSKEEVEKELSDLKSSVKQNKQYVQLEYALSQSKRENRAVKELHREVMNKEYLDEGYKHLQKNNQEFTKLFNMFRLNFYNIKNEDPDEAIRLVEKYICDTNNAIQFKYKRSCGF